jgi:enterochelin esterase family protein
MMPSGFNLKTSEGFEPTTINSNAIFINFYDFITQFKQANDSDKLSLVNSYISWQEQHGFPAIINDTHVIFIYYTSGSDSSLNLAGDFNSWDFNYDPMSKLGPSINFFYRLKVFDPTARLDYKFVKGGSNWILDPRNPNKMPGGYGDNSELRMPKFKQPTEILFRDNIAHGQLNTVSTSFVGANPTVQVYLPPNYDPLMNYSTAYFTDGSEYLIYDSTVNIIDNLIAEGRIEPIIGVFIDPWQSVNDRVTWYDCQFDSYINYIDVIVDFIDTTYATNTSATARLHLGDSLGGQISSYVGISRHNLFKNVGSHSGAFWYGQNTCNLIDKIEKANETMHLKFWFSAGVYEEAIWNDTKKVQQMVYDKNWDCNSMYLQEGHSWGSWRHTLDDLLEFFYTPNPSDTNQCTATITQPTTETSSTSTTEISSTGENTSTTSTSKSSPSPFPISIIFLVIPIATITKKKYSKS